MSKTDKDSTLEEFTFYWKETENKQSALDSGKSCGEKEKQSKRMVSARG